MSIEYKLKPVHIEVDSPEEMAFPPILGRIIEKTGQPITFTMQELLDNREKLEKYKKELQAKHDYEKVIKENVEKHHPFVKDFSEEELHTLHMYKEAYDWVTKAEKKIKEIENQIKLDEKEIETIKKAIPEIKEELESSNEGEDE